MGKGGHGILGTGLGEFGGFRHIEKIPVARVTPFVRP